MMKTGVPVVGLVFSFAVSVLHAAPTVQVTPTAIDRFEAGSATLAITNLVGSAALVRLRVDVDGDGVTDPEDLVIWTDLVPDNVTEWAPTMFADTNPAAGAITVAPRLFTPLSFPYTVGDYLWEVEDTGNGTTDTDAFDVTQTATGQTVSGTVTDEGAAAVGGAMVVVGTLAESCDGPESEYSAMTNASGQYSIEVPPGDPCNHRVVQAAKPAYLTDQTEAVQLVFHGSDSFPGTALTVYAGTHDVDGAVRYSTGDRVGEGIPGTLVVGYGGPYLTVAFTDENGAYLFRLEDGDWELEPGPEVAHLIQGAVVPEDLSLEGEITGPVTVPDLEIPAANAFVRGTLYDDASGAQPGRFVEANQDWPCTPECHETSTVTAPDGSFIVGAYAQAPDTHTYRLKARIPLAGLLARDTSVDLQNGDDLVGRDVVHVTPTATVRGTITDIEGTPLENVCFEARQWGPPVYRARAASDCNGQYAMPSLDGDWNFNYEGEGLAGYHRDLDVTQFGRTVSVAGADIDGVDFILGPWSERSMLIDIEPESGPAGSEAVLDGYNLRDDELPQITVGGIPANLGAIRPDFGVVAFEVPPSLGAGVYPVRVENARFGGPSNEMCFEVTGEPLTSGCTFEGTVTFDGSPVEDAVVAVVVQDRGWFVRGTTTDATGYWSTAAPDDSGPYDIMFIPPEGTPWVWEPYESVACGSVQDHAFQTGLAVDGNVVDNDGTGVPNVTVQAATENQSSEILTDEDGYYLVHVPAGAILELAFLTPQQGRYVSNPYVAQQIDVPTTFPPIYLETGHLLVGNVLDKNGDGTRAYLQSDDRVTFAFTGRAINRNCEGQFVMALPESAHRLTIHGKGPEIDDSVTEVQWVDVPGDTFAEFPFHAFGLQAIQHTGSEARIANNLLARARLGQPVYVMAENLTAGSEALFTLGAGGTAPGVGTEVDVERGILVTHVPAGTVTGDLYLSAAGGDSPAFPFEVLPGSWTPGPYVVGGTVDNGAVPVPDTLVVLFWRDSADPDCNADPVVMDYDVTDSGGAFSMDHPGGDLLLAFYPPPTGTLAPGQLTLEDQTSDVTGLTQSLANGRPVHIRALTGSPAVPVRNTLFEQLGTINERRLTDANGDATMYLPPGVQEYRLYGPTGSRLLAEYYESAQGEFGDVVMEVGAFVGGRAVEDDGADVAGARTLAWPDAVGSDARYFESVSGAGGIYRGPVRYVEDYELRIESPVNDLAETGFFGQPGLSYDVIRHPSDVLAAAGAVEGYIRDAVTSAPLSGITMLTWQNDSGAPGVDIANAQSCDDGFYRINPPAGSQFLQGNSASFSAPAYFEGWFTSGPTDYCVDDAAQFTVVEGETIVGVDVALEPKSFIEGSVTWFDDPRAGLTVDADGARLGSCDPVATTTDGAGTYRLEVPEGSDYRVRSDSPPESDASEQCFDRFDDCTDFTPVATLAGLTTTDVDFPFGREPQEVSGGLVPLILEHLPSDDVRLTFEKLPPIEHAATYNVYQGLRGDYGTATATECHIDPATLVDNGDGTYSHTVSPAPGVGWFLVSASNEFGESVLGHGRALTNPCN